MIRHGKQIDTAAAVADDDSQGHVSPPKGATGAIDSSRVLLRGQRHDRPHLVSTATTVQGSMMDWNTLEDDLVHVGRRLLLAGDVETS
jgi:hypothetical protein